MAERLTIVCWLWRQENGRATYGAAHVNILRAMLARHLSLEHELVCATDMPGGIDPRVRIVPLPNDFSDVRLPRWGTGRPQCLRRLSLFRPDAATIFGGDRLVSLDLDVVITASLDSLFSGGEDFRICRGTAARRSFNGSLYMIRAGSRPDVYTTFTPERAVEASLRHVGSDQSWLAATLAGAPTWGPEHGVVCVQQIHLAKELRMITYPGPTKPWIIAAIGREKMVAKHYRGERRDRCLVLGYGPHVWDEVAAAVDDGPFGGVIAAPEIVPHWPGPVLAVADDDEHAERLAAMHGFENLTWCGRSGGQADGASR